MKKPKRSQTRTCAGRGAEFQTLFAVVLDAIVLKLMVPSDGLPFWFKAVFFLAAMCWTCAVPFLWFRRLKGGSVSMKLSDDPVPHGVPVVVEFEMNRSIDAHQWVVEAKIESSARNQSGFGLLWSQDFAASLSGAHSVKAEVTLPSDMPSTAASDPGTIYFAGLVLKADRLEWAFSLETRAARADEG